MLGTWRLRRRRYIVEEIESWESGQTEVPKDVADEIVRLDAALERVVIESLNCARHSPGTESVLIRYENAKEVGRFDPQVAERFGPVALQVHAALVMRLAQGLKRMGRKVRIIYMDRRDYDDWRDRQRIDESDAARIAWASRAAAVTT